MTEVVFALRSTHNIGRAGFGPVVEEEKKDSKEHETKDSRDLLWTSRFRLQHPMRSPRFRFWRNILYVAPGLVKYNIADKAPERDDQFACQRDDHCLACATTAVGGAGAMPQCQPALLLKHQKAPGELDHGAGVAGSGEPLFATARPALIRGA
jgi:hypothetical protein